MLYCRRKQEREKELEQELEDEQTQTSSPGGGWQSRLTAFLHVHRGSRASSRKSSRASDASDLSELGGPWLNLPLLLLSSAANMASEELGLTCESADVSILVNGAKPEAAGSPTAPPAQARRRSFYSFFQRHPNAPDDDQPNAQPQPQTLKPKRVSLSRRKAFDRSGSVQLSAEPMRTECGSNGSDVSILVTQPSPDQPAGLLRRQSETSVVQALVHRESEEYAEDSGSLREGSESSQSQPDQHLHR